jgi:DNA-binding NarL/FixJ family response regulator
LTSRERGIAYWLTAGKTNAEIAAILAANVRTVEKHVEVILKKLGVENRTAASVLIAASRRNASPA